MKPSELMRLALPFLWDGRGSYVPAGKKTFLCWAISEATYCASGAELPGAGAAQWALRCHIHKALGEVRGLPMYSLGDWLLNVAAVPAQELTSERVQEHRRQWALQIIKHFEAEGK